MKKVGFTTSIPVELVFAAGYQPVDINNIFVNDNNPEKLVECSERVGFRNSCAWIKGMYSCIMEKIDLDIIIGVVEGIVLIPGHLEKYSVKWSGEYSFFLSYLQGL